MYEERAVAFVDVLGFKSLVEKSVHDSRSFDQLKKLLELLESVVPVLDSEVDPSVSKRLIPKHLYVSDTIILSALLSDPSRRDYDGLSIVIMRVIQLTHHFLERGFLLRGGISVGKVWHGDSNIVGPAYHEAHGLENDHREPIVVLSRLAASRWRGGSRMCLEHEGRLFVNGLHDFYVQGRREPDSIARRYELYEKIVEEKSRECTCPAARKKWEWFKEFLKKEAMEASCTTSDPPRSMVCGEGGTFSSFTFWHGET